LRAPLKSSTTAQFVQLLNKPDGEAAVKARRILYVGPLGRGETSKQRYDALRDLGYDLDGIDSSLSRKASFPERLAARVCHRLFRYGLNQLPAFDLARVNKALLEHMEADTWDYLWLDKALAVHAKTLKSFRLRQKSCRIVGYSPDDMNQRHSQSRQFLLSLPFYDLYATTKSYNVDELRQLGCKKLIFIGNSYDPGTHYPRALTPEQRQELGGPVGFVGSYEKERANSIVYLCRNGIQVRIWGHGWQQFKGRPNALVMRRSMVGDDYARVISAFDINLAFLRKINRDLQTTRSVEIPACGSFMLAERTKEHLDLFEEGKEAEFFSSDEELLAKTRYYLSHPECRIKIAAAGRKRCLESGYSHHERLKQIFSALNA
jgi:hypothetical protein